MTNKEENQIIRALFPDSYVSYYNDKRKACRRRIFKSGRASNSALKGLVTKLNKMGIKGWSVWDSGHTPNGHFYCQTGGIVKVESL